MHRTGVAAGLAVGLWGRHELYVAVARGVSCRTGAPTCGWSRIRSSRWQQLVRQASSSWSAARIASALRAQSADGRARAGDRAARATRPRRAGSRAGAGCTAPCSRRTLRCASLSLAIRRALEQGRTEIVERSPRASARCCGCSPMDSTTAQIADRLGISQRTARAHVSACSSASGWRTAPRRR